MEIQLDLSATERTAIEEAAALQGVTPDEFVQNALEKLIAKLREEQPADKSLVSQYEHRP